MMVSVKVILRDSDFQHLGFGVLYQNVSFVIQQTRRYILLCSDLVIKIVSNSLLTR